MNTYPTPARAEQMKEFLARHRFADARLQPLAGDASFRRYVRVFASGKNAMLMDAPPEKENVRSYLVIAEYLHRSGYSAPAILAGDMGSGLLLIEDLGDDSFTLVLKKGGDERQLYEAAIDLLADWQQKKCLLTDPSHLSLPAYDNELLLNETSLFADWYLPQVLGKKKAADVRPEYMALWRSILERAPLADDGWVHRDFHADNLMWLPDRIGIQRVGLLDFQDGVFGDPAYDAVSLLEDARRDVPPKLAEEMIARYLAATGADAERFRTAYAILGAQRNSKIVGIFTRLAARDNKFAYLNFLPRVWAHLERDLQHPALAELKRWTDRHVEAKWRGVIEVSQAAPAAATA